MAFALKHGALLHLEEGRDGDLTEGESRAVAEINANETGSWHKALSLIRLLCLRYHDLENLPPQYFEDRRDLRRHAEEGLEARVWNRSCSGRESSVLILLAFIIITHLPCRLSNACLSSRIPNLRWTRKPESCCWKITRSITRSVVKNSSDFQYAHIFIAE